LGVFDTIVFFKGSESCAFMVRNSTRFSKEVELIRREIEALNPHEILVYDRGTNLWFKTTNENAQLLNDLLAKPLMRGQRLETKKQPPEGSSKNFLMETKKTKIIIVDDHPIVRQGLTELINSESDLEVCAQAEDAHQALKLIREVHPDMAIVDISLKQTSGMELIKDINAQYPRLQVLALSMHDESLYAERALRAGARGYIMKQEATEKVVSAIRKAQDGQLYVSDRMQERMVRKLVGSKSQVIASVVGSLSDRELEVFMLIGQGFSTRQIADKFHLSVKTIETYRAHIKEKLNLPSAAEMLQYAIQWVKSRSTQ